MESERRVFKGVRDRVRAAHELVYAARRGGESVLCVICVCM